jgi:ATP-dependent Clp protease ATP-binding subunit ClpA
MLTDMETTLEIAEGAASNDPEVGLHAPRARKCLELSLREALVRKDDYVGAQHIALVLISMKDGAAPLILSALGVSPDVLRAAILDRYRKAG